MLAVSPGFLDFFGLFTCVCKATPAPPQLNPERQIDWDLIIVEMSLRGAAPQD